MSRPPLLPDDGRATCSLARYATHVDYSGLPAAARRIALHCIVDWYAVTIAGARDPAMRSVVDDVLSEGGHPLATLAGTPHRSGLYPAALINGTASHMLDYDDVNLAITGHPTAVVFSALLPLAEARRSTGREVLSAFAAGYEVACRVGRWLGNGHYERGYHATATVGVIGAGAGCARLLGLDAPTAVSALGIAATQASGLKSVFGSDLKPLHAGLAARNGLMAANLAAKGFQANPDTLEAAQGYARTLSPAPDIHAAFAEPAGGLHMLSRLFKYHASCYGTHAAIDCMREIVESQQLSAADIASITVKAHPGSRNMCNIAAPRDAAEAKFSLRLNTAFAAMKYNTGDIQAYTPERLGNQTVIALRDLAQIIFTDEVDMMEAEVSVTTHQGLSFVSRKDAGTPEADLDKEEQRLRAKFSTLVAPVTSADACASLLERLFSFDKEEDVTALARAIGHTQGI
ncbi:MmgE/PrpD family protein [Pusillimonas sp. SM2304]|uniref:MmgE/PrpD family protein n=1 Tax=Pusillimonas sp. SM2304 TaxID=3073241 RepID=UPI002874BC5A|nr:MmgE/PrpD family protein [Pusillimonas sp. SM2304]MDS1138891.1 MmgE/PrpD family protein [Pusillimonas sp. SM2304]